MMGVDSVLLVAAVGKAEVEDALEMVIVYNVRMKLSMVKIIADGFYLRCLLKNLDVMNHLLGQHLIIVIDI